MHLAQLVFQHNNLVATADDCRNMYVARQLFRKLAIKGQLSIFGLGRTTGQLSPQAMPRHYLLPRAGPTPSG